VTKKFEIVIMTSCYTDTRYIEIYVIVGRSYNVKGLTSLWGVPNMFRRKSCRISQSQLLFGRVPFDMFGVENVYYNKKLARSELTNQRRLVLRL